MGFGIRICDESSMKLKPIIKITNFQSNIKLNKGLMSLKNYQPNSLWIELKIT